VKTLAILFGVLVLGGLLAGGAYFLLSQEYFVGLDDEQIVIYQGVDVELGPLDLARVVERTELSADDVQPWFRSRLEEGVPAAGLSDARSIVETMREEIDDTDDDGLGRRPGRGRHRRRDGRRSVSTTERHARPASRLRAVEARLVAFAVLITAAAAALLSLSESPDPPMEALIYPGALAIAACSRTRPSAPPHPTPIRCCCR
jgi:hypothetical protein